MKNMKNCKNEKKQKLFDVKKILTSTPKYKSYDRSPPKSIKTDFKTIITKLSFTTLCGILSINFCEKNTFPELHLFGICDCNTHPGC